MSENDLVSRADSLMQRRKAAATPPPIEDFPILTLEAPLHLDDPTEDSIPLLTEEIPDLPLLFTEIEAPLDAARHAAESDEAQEADNAHSIGEPEQAEASSLLNDHDETAPALALAISGLPAQTTNLADFTDITDKLTAQLTEQLSVQLSAQLADRLTAAVEHRLAAELPTLIEAQLAVLEDHLRAGVREIVKSAIQDFMTHTRPSPPSR